MKTSIAVLIALAAAATPLAAQDTLRFKDPKKSPDLQGEVVALSFRVVEIDIRGVKQQIDARLVAELIPSNDHKNVDFSRGEEALANGEVAAAIARFERVASDPRAAPLLRQKAAIHIVRCTPDPQGIIASARALRAKRPDSFYLQESYQREVIAHLVTGDAPAAKAAIAAFAAQAAAQAIQEWANSADLLDAGLAEFQKNWRAALAVYRKYLRDPDLGDDAALGELRCLTALADFPGLKARAEAIIRDAAGKKDANPRLLIAAYTGRGDVELNGGKTKDGLMAYLQGAMALAQGETSREHEAALARVALTCVKIAAAGSGDERAATYRVRTKEVLDELNRTYPGSRYRKEIEEALRRLR